MIPVQCPYCRHSSSLNKVQPGRFQPRCKSCQKKFFLVVKAAGESVAARTWTMEEVARKKRDTKGTAATDDKTRIEPSPEPSPERSPPSNPNATAADASADTQRGKPGSTGVNLSAHSQLDSEADSDDEFLENQPSDAPDTGRSIPQRLGGYKVIRELGRGGLGVVYLAHQLSLDRHVALKTIQGKIAQNSAAISRFIREAYAAAQLVHHNVVQIYDLGRDGETNFFSMEFVPGENLAQMVKREGPIEPKRAARLILQAARGLHYAHQQGMVHRDIKPANLMVNDQGVVKVADLGLVKMAGDEETARDKGFDELARMSAEDLTLAGHTLGTANYMAPEQADNSATVDHRADIYSLGCTLYVLLTGRTPFRGTSALDIITKHRTEPVVRPELIVDRVDGQLSDIVVRMVAKNLDDRYSDLAHVIGDLETYLGISAANILNPDGKQVAVLEQTQNAWYGLPLAKLRTWAPLGFAGLCPVLVLILSFVSWRWATAIISLAIVTPLTVFLTSGIRDRGPLYEKVRELVFQAPLRRWITSLVAGLLLLVVLVVTGLLTSWIVFAILGITLAALYYFVVDTQLSAQRKETLQPLRNFLTEKRLAGIDEKSLQRFVAKFSGRDWEEFFEELFGYPAMRTARAELIATGGEGKRKKYRPWRDRVMDRIDARLNQSKQKMDAEKLQRVERDALIATGVAPESADAQAKHFADAIVREAAQWRSAAVNKPASAIDPAVAAAQKRARIKAMLAEARGGKQRQQSLMEQMDAPMEMFLGNHVRLILGSLLLVGCAMWVWQNGLLDRVSAEQLRSTAESAIENRGANLSDLSDVAKQVGLDPTIETKAWSFPVVGVWFDSLLPGIAGLMLVFTSFFRGWKLSLFALPAALIIWFGPALGITGFGGFVSAEIVSVIAGLVIAVLGTGIARKF